MARGKRGTLRQGPKASHVQRAKSTYVKMAPEALTFAQRIKSRRLTATPVQAPKVPRTPRRLWGAHHRAATAAARCKVTPSVVAHCVPHMGAATPGDVASRRTDAHSARNIRRAPRPGARVSCETACSNQGRRPGPSVQPLLACRGLRADLGGKGEPGGGKQGQIRGPEKTWGLTRASRP